jgi:hypothetical protein
MFVANISLFNMKLMYYLNQTRNLGALGCLIYFP